MTVSEVKESPDATYFTCRKCKGQTWWIRSDRIAECGGCGMKYTMDSFQWDAQVVPQHVVFVHKLPDTVN